MKKTIYNWKGSAGMVAIGALALTISACDSSSGSGSSSKQGQAIDGYLVNSAVFCDDEENGTTGAAGIFTCPKRTDLIRIRGGIDVGFDATKTEGGDPFVGELQAPGSLDYVTPLSTLAVEIAKVEGEFDPLQFDAAVTTLATALGVESLDLNVDAASEENIEIVRLNAQVQEIVSAFSGTVDEYNTVLTAFVTDLKVQVDTGNTVSLTDSVESTLQRVNTLLASSSPDLQKSEAELEVLTSEVKTQNEQIAEAGELDSVALAAASEPSDDSVISIERSDVKVHFSASGVPYSLSDFESDAKDTKGMYTIVMSDGAESIYFDREALSVNRNMNSQQVGIGFEIKSTDENDKRRLSISSRDARISMDKGDKYSIRIVLPENAQIYARAISSDGVETVTQFDRKQEAVFDGDEHFVNFNLRSAERQLENKGIEGFLDRDGNFQVTMVIDGLKIAQTEGAVSVLPQAYTIDAGDQTVTGRGFRGYMSYYYSTLN